MTTISDISSAVLATATALLAVTTPYSPPTDCSTVFGINSFTASVLSSTPTTITLLAPDTAGGEYLRCQPSGLANVASSLRQSFSPAVCPSGWWYNNMATTVSGTKTLSTATCCQP